MIQVHVLRVFVDECGNFGNPLGVVFDPGALDRQRRQQIAALLGYSETIFVDDVAEARVQIFTPGTELPFAGHPLVGVAWLLSRLTGRVPDVLRPVRLADPVPVVMDGNRTWVRGAVVDAPAWEHLQMSGPDDIERLAPPMSAGDRSKTQVWAWLDEPGGIIRARVFASAFGVVEDEACGSATMLLANGLGRRISVRHGRGSLIHARPVDEGRVDVGGDVVTDGIREVAADHAAGDPPR